MSVFLRLLIVFFALFSFPSSAAESSTSYTSSGVGYAALIIFGFAYCLVMAEEYLQLRKSKPVLLAAGLIWIIIGFAFQADGQIETAKHALEHNLLEYPHNQGG